MFYFWVFFRFISAFVYFNILIIDIFVFASLYHYDTTTEEKIGYTFLTIILLPIFFVSFYDNLKFIEKHCSKQNNEFNNPLNEPLINLPV